jgi:nucleoside-diphosphate-sugar epimerase
MRILLTGAGGFVGRRLCALAADRGWKVVAVTRQGSLRPLPTTVERVITVDGIDDTTAWPATAFDRVDTVIHAAAHVHQLTAADAARSDRFQAVNVGGTRRLAEAAVGRVGRFVFISSAHAICSISQEVIDEGVVGRPDTPYGQSKWDAEQLLWQVAAGTGMPTTVLRPVPVYGPQQVGRLGTIIQKAAQGWYLPVGGVTSRRSLVFVDNLADAALHAASHPQAVGRTFFVTDGPAVTLEQLVRTAAVAAGRAPRILPAPQTLLRLAGSLLGKSTAIERLLGSLEVDGRALVNELGWQAPYTLAEGLSRTVGIHASQTMTLPLNAPVQQRTAA